MQALLVMFPWKHNTFTTRNHLESAHNELFSPLIAGFSPGGARVRLEGSASACTDAAAELEGFLRPLWGIVPYICGGGEFSHLDLYRKGLVNGCDPDHPEFWGYPGDMDQILVDLAAIAFAICFCPDQFWHPLTRRDMDVVAAYLKYARARHFCSNNWKFFKVFIDIALQRTGYTIETKSTEQYLVDLELYYLGDGWYGDGKPHRIDYYNAFAFHFYGLIYVKLQAKQDPDRCQRFMDRANQFAGQFIHWFSEDGAALAYGRSLNYRFSVVGFWGVYASVLDPNETPAIPWGVLKGIYLNNFKWWAKQPVFTLGSKVLSLGYSYPNNFMTERYNSPQSPYWATKGFSALFMSESHPFWQANVVPLQLSATYLPVVGMYFSHQPANTIAIINGPWNDEYQTEKYGKFAYSTRYGFGVVTNHRTFPLAHLDNMLGFSFDNRHFFVREKYQAYVKDGKLVSKWVPVEGVEVETWIFPMENYHIRTHYIENHTLKPVFTKEGGFSIGFGTKNDKNITSGQAETTTEADYSMIRDLKGSRTANVCVPEPNANVLYPKTLLPELLGTVGPNCETVYGCLVAAFPRESATVPGDLATTDRDPLGWARVPCNVDSFDSTEGRID